MTTADLTPYLPRLLLEWQEETPEERYRSIEGTLVFTDLSGFTAISERLAKLGRLGAEELVEHLDATFAELLSVSWALGGSLLKFGGDALLLFFRGERHAVRAVRAAAEMQATLRRVGRIRTSAGPARLRMSVGVHTGAFDFFLVGKEHRELLITGRATTTTAEMETAADATEVVLSPATAACLPASSVGAEKGPGILLARTPRIREADRQAPQPWPSAFDAEAFVPASLRSHLGDPAGREPEHRQIAIAFIHLANLDRLLLEEGPDEAADRLEALLASVATHFGEHGVAFLATDLYNDGPKILAATGAPRAWGNDEERLLRALRGVLDGDHGIELRIGVNRGYAFTGDIGATFRRTYVTMGDVVNTAARVMSKAAPGEMLATTAVLDRSATAFETEELAPFAAKGKTLPLVTHRVGRIVGTRRVTGERRPLLGRDRELTTLLEGVDAARQGMSSVVEVVADAGMGKSRLLEEVCSAAGDLPVVSFGCDQYEASTPYAAVRKLLEAVFGGAVTADELARRVAEVAPELSPWLPLLAVPFGLEVPSTPEVDALDEQFAKVRLQDSVVTLLFALLPTATAVVIEDTHWMDAISGDLLTRLLRVQVRPPWFICVARRPLEGGFAAGALATASMELAPLDDEAAVALGQAVAPGRFLPRELQALAQRAGGNPLFLTELVRAAAEADVDALPETVDGLIAARLDMLDAGDRRLLRLASVLGMTVDLDVLAAATGEAIPRDPAAWAPLSSFLQPDGDGFLRFAHALYRDTAYAALPFRRRREVHRLVGEVIAATTEDEAAAAPLLSLHFAEARDWERAWRYSMRAGEHAKQRFANADAATFLARAADAARQLRRLDDVAEASFALAEAHLYSTRYEAAATAATNAARAGANEVMRARAGFLNGEAARRRGEHAVAVRHYERALRRLEGRDDEASLQWRSRILTVLGGVQHARGRYAAAIEVFKNAEVAARAAGDDRALAHAHAHLFRAHVVLGNFEEAARYRDLPLHVFEREGAMLHLSSFEIVLGNAEQEAGRWSAASEWWGRAAARARACGDDNQVALAEYNRSEVLCDLGRLDEALAALERALIVWRPARYAVGIAVAALNAARIAALRSPDDATVEELRVAAADLRRLGLSTYEAKAHAWRAEACIAVAAFEAAAEAVEHARRCAVEGIARHRLQSALMRVDAIAAAVGGDVDGAVAAFGESLRAADEAGSDYERTVTLHTWARLDDVIGPPPEGSEAEVRRTSERLGIVELPDLVPPSLVH